ncbi:hypothetical protein P7C71_g4539, partial [Lecanoromycetidae sp. Uapishka_2]
MAFDRTKILSMLDNLLQAPNQGKSCGSVPVDYPEINNSYNALTVNYVYSIPCIGYCVGSQDSQGTLPMNGLGYAPGTCKVNFMQYQAFAENGGTQEFFQPDLALATWMDVQILDADRYLIGGVWGQVNIPDQTWNLDSQLPEVLVVNGGAVQSSPIAFSYNGSTFDISSSQCSLSGSFNSGIRYGSCNFDC